MDRDFAEQGVDAGIADVVYAVNTIHIARDLAATLARVRETLKPGGVAVFSECVRPFPGQPIYVEFVFNFLENFTGVATDPRTRPNHGFLTPENWRRAFAAAGFEKPRDPPRRRGAREALRRVLRRGRLRPPAAVTPARPPSARLLTADCLLLICLPVFDDGSSQNGKKQYHWSGYSRT